MLFDLSDKSDLILFENKVNQLKNKGATVEFSEKTKTRTITQNKAMHLYFKMIADVFNELGKTFSLKGMPIEIPYTPELVIEIPYTPELVKETIWKPVQNALFGKKSTTELTTKDVSEIAMPIEAFLAKMSINLPFPSIDNL